MIFYILNKNVSSRDNTFMRCSVLVQIRRFSTEFMKKKYNFMFVYILYSLVLYLYTINRLSRKWYWARKRDLTIAQE